MGVFCDGVEFKVHHCGECGVVFAFTTDFHARRVEDRRSWYCPNGHQRHFTGPNEATKLRQELDRERQVREAAEARAGKAEQNLSQVTRAHRKMRERVMNGVCPCCNRSFSNLREHMKSEHADFGAVKTMFALRQAFGMTQAAVAREAGVDTTYVSLYERDKRLPTYAKERLDGWLEQQEAKAP